ncbi:MAG: adenosyl-hopene transferase HpnH [Anaerolineales bacterium]|nr:adenosyl-hopene transferase HpnH [Anaerolineales bacterium]
MSLPISVELAVAWHIAKARITHGSGPVPIVLMLELTHACNLRCAGCGRIREYAATRSQSLTRDEARASMVDANTPFVSISGGEPLLHPDAPAIAADALALGKVVYLCTNGLLLAQRMAEFTPHPHLFFNVHLDGQPELHDALTGLPGAAERALEGIRLARQAGFGVTTNTTIFSHTPVDDTVALFRQLTDLGVAGIMTAPAFAYEVGVSAGTLTRAEAHAWFRAFREQSDGVALYHTPLYMEFLCGERDLECMPWGTVTRNPQGWKKPCYLLSDGHVSTFDELMQGTDWSAYGPGKDPRCTNCLMHSGFEPSVMASMRNPRDLWHLARWQFGR